MGCGPPPGVLPLAAIGLGEIHHAGARGLDAEDLPKPSDVPIMLFMRMAHSVMGGVARRPGPGFCPLFVLACVQLAIVGCADATYDMIRLGQQPQEYERILPADRSRRTHLGLCYLDSDIGGRTDAIVVLLTADRRVAARIQSTCFERDWGFKVDRGFRLRGELDPRLYDLHAAGPIDTLRAIAGDLSNYQGEKLASDAYAWVAAGLVRLMQCWPNVSDVGVETHRLTDLFERVAGGGAARIAVDARGVYRFEYEQGITR